MESDSKELQFTIHSCNQIINLGVLDDKKKGEPEQESDPVINEPML